MQSLEAKLKEILAINTQITQENEILKKRLVELEKEVQDVSCSRCTYLVLSLLLRSFVFLAVFIHR